MIRRGRWWRRIPCGAGDVDLDRPWRQLEYCVIDVETTGLDLKRDEIVSYGAVIVRDGRIVGRSSCYRLVRPQRVLSPDAVMVHALRAEDLAGAPPMSDCIDELVHLLSTRVLVAHAAWIEQAFIGRALRLHGWRLTGPTIDTAALARASGIFPSTDFTREPPLEGVALGLGLPVHTPHHALGDAMTTAQLLVVLSTKLAQAAEMSARRLVAISEDHAV